MTSGSDDAEKVLLGMIDTLASIEHERWSHWQRYMHDKGKKQNDGSLLLPEELVARWERQIATPFAELSDEEKNSDRDQVRRYLYVIIEELQNRGKHPSFG